MTEKVKAEEFREPDDDQDWQEQIDESSNEKIMHPFDPTKIDISLKQMIIESFIRRLKEDEIDLNTEFQRRGDLWNQEQQSRLIESLLIRMPLPAFYFDGTDDNKWLIVDGLQRLTTLYKFIIKKNFKLTGMEFLKQFEGCGYDDLPRSMQRRIEETQVIAYVINPGTPSNVKFNIFKRINTGGLTLNSQEIRHALYQGVPAKYLEELAVLPEFLKATGYKIKTERMEDRNYVLRFLAFTMFGYKKYKNIADLDSFLNLAMEQIRKTTEDERLFLKEKFRRAMEAAVAIFGNDAFRKRYHPWESRKPLNKALFETWAVNLGNLDLQQINMLIERKEQLLEKSMLLMRNTDFEKSVTTSTSSVRLVEKRFSAIEKLIMEVLS